MIPHFIFYVADQARSAAFYSHVLAINPRLDVPGMTEFELPGGAVLGLMPEANIVRLLGDAVPDPRQSASVPRAELYLVLPEVGPILSRAIDAGAKVVSPPSARDWGHTAAYALDPDGHVVAFAQVTDGNE